MRTLLKLSLALVVAACAGADGDPDRREIATTTLALSTDTAPADAAAGADDDDAPPEAVPAIPPGTYSFDEMKTLLIAGHPEFAAMIQAEVSREPPSPGYVAVPVAEVASGCQNPPENAPSPDALAVYREPSWDYEVPLTTRLAALQPSDLTTLEAIRASLTAAAPDAEADAP
jgi:hypothetical protein